MIYCVSTLLISLGACAARVTCVRLSDALPFDTVNLNDGTNGFSATRSRLYKKAINARFVRKLWCHLLTRDILRGYCSDIPRTFSTAEPSKGPKTPTIGSTLPGIRLEVRQRASFLLYTVVSVFCYFNCSCHVPVF